MAHEQPGQTLEATALVHEAYLRLVGDDPKKPWDGRGHFFAAAAEAMRRILVTGLAIATGRSVAADAAASRIDLDDRWSTSCQTTTCWPSTKPCKTWPSRTRQGPSWCVCVLRGPDARRGG